MDGKKGVTVVQGVHDGVIFATGYSFVNADNLTDHINSRLGPFTFEVLGGVELTVDVKVMGSRADWANALLLLLDEDRVIAETMLEDLSMEVQEHE